jgi:hypothetical protein
MLHHIQPGELYWADIAGKTVKVRVIEQSRELPLLWLCADAGGKYILVPDAALHRVGELRF